MRHQPGGYSPNAHARHNHGDATRAGLSSAAAGIDSKSVETVGSLMSTAKSTLPVSRIAAQ
jgi:hypothetical protein